MITWEQLTEGEQNALSRWINIDREFVNEFEKGLQAKGLIRIVRIDHHRHQNMLNDAGRAVLAQEEAGQPEAEGWYYSSVAQWMPEYSTEKINNYDGPFPTWQKALEALFNEVGNDMDSFRADLKRMQAQLAASLEREAALKAALTEVYRMAEASADGQDEINEFTPDEYIGQLETSLITIRREAREALAASDGGEGG